MTSAGERFGRADRALLIISITWAVVQICSLVVDYIAPAEGTGMFRYEDQALPRLVVYWGAGAVLMALGCLLWAARRTTARCLAVAGTYLMLLGSYGGVFGSETYMPYRIAACSVTLLWLLAIAWKASVELKEPA
jgi:hypothetical protein